MSHVLVTAPFPSHLSHLSHLSHNFTTPRESRLQKRRTEKSHSVTYFSLWLFHLFPRSEKKTGPCESQTSPPPPPPDLKEETEACQSHCSPCQLHSSPTSLTLSLCDPSFRDGKKHEYSQHFCLPPLPREDTQRDTIPGVPLRLNHQCFRGWEEKT